MSRALDYKQLNLSDIKKTLVEIKTFRNRKEYKEADVLRQHLLRLDQGMRITQTETCITLWHWPVPAFSGEYHYCNYGEFVANSN